jgi:hypothetical protein
MLSLVFGSQLLVGVEVVVPSYTKVMPVAAEIFFTAANTMEPPPTGAPVVRNRQWIGLQGFQRTGLPETMLENLYSDDVVEVDVPAVTSSGWVHVAVAFGALAQEEALPQDEAAEVADVEPVTNGTTRAAAAAAASA